MVHMSDSNEDSSMSSSSKNHNYCQQHSTQLSAQWGKKRHILY